MYDFLLQTLIVLSLSIVIYLLARGIPRVSESGAAFPQTSAFDRFVSKLPLAEIDEALNSFLEKFLRKIKVMVMKIDNAINNWINKVKKPTEIVPPASSEAPVEKPDLFDRTKNIT